MITEAQTRADALGVNRRETAIAVSVQRTSDIAIHMPLREVPPDVFCLTPPPVPPRISFVNTKRIHPHRAVRSQGCSPTAVELEQVRQHWETARCEPLILNHQRTIIDGYKRWLVARELGIDTLPCVILEISDDEALNQILAHASAKNWWTPCRRIALALTREEALSERARENQRAGGRTKAPSILAEAQHIDVCREIARMAGTGTGSVRKVKGILAAGCPLLKQEALRRAISIDAAWKISKFDNDEQMRELGRRASKRRSTRRVKAQSRAYAAKCECDGEREREVIGHIQQTFDKLTRSGPLEKFRDPGLELLARMEREIDVRVSNMAMSQASEPTGDAVQAG
jgi:ParB-like chromosome segregation protein Spo0J